MKGVTTVHVERSGTARGPVVEMLYWIRLFVTLIASVTWSMCWSQWLAQCPPIHLQGVFAYEMSSAFWSGDDMVYRRAALVRVLGDSIDTSAGIYMFECGINISTDCEQDSIVQAVNYSAHSFNNAWYDRIEQLPSHIELTSDGLDYKLVYLSISVLPMDAGPIFVRRNGEMIQLMMQRYLIIDFSTVKSIAPH